VGWKQFIRQAEAAARRYERTARASARRSERQAMARHRENVRLHREHERAMVQQQKAWAQQQNELARQDAAKEAAEYENYISMLVSLHHDCTERWDWRAVAAAPPPAEPMKANPEEVAARAALANYVPGFFDKLLGGAQKHRAQLEQAVHQGIAIDHQRFEAAMNDHRMRIDQWRHLVTLASGVLAGDPDAFRAALGYVAAFEEIEGFGTLVTLDSVIHNAARFTCVIEDQEIVPSEEVKLTTAGKLSSNEMATGKYWALYQDHVASCAIRIAREAYAITPIERVIVNVKAARVNSRTGHLERPTVLAVHFSRDAFMRLNFTAIDPSDSLKNFPHKMKFKKTAGFEPVDDIEPDEQWVTT
jgi:hypothetical protein